MVREGLRLLLEQQPGWEVVGEAADGERAAADIARLRPDVAIMDIPRPRVIGLEVIRRVQRQSPGTKIIILSTSQDDAHVAQALEAGVAGYLVKDDPGSELLAAIRAAQTNGAYLSPSISKAVINGYRQRARAASEADPLTDREREVLTLIAEGRTNPEIARKLSVSVRTVETHRRNLMEKLDIHDVVGLVKYAIRRGLITVE